MPARISDFACRNAAMHVVRIRRAASMDHLQLKVLQQKQVELLLRSTLGASSAYLGVLIFNLGFASSVTKQRGRMVCARASIVVVGPGHCQWNEDEQVQGDDLIPRNAMHTLDQHIAQQGLITDGLPGCKRSPSSKTRLGDPDDDRNVSPLNIWRNYGVRNQDDCLVKAGAANQAKTTGCAWFLTEHSYGV